MTPVRAVPPPSADVIALPGARSVRARRSASAPVPTAPRAAAPPTAERPSRSRPRPAGPSPVLSAPRIPGRGRDRWAAYALVACGLALPPWLVVLAATLPPTADAPHWAAAWVGLDAMEAVGLLATGFLTLRRHPLRPAAAGVTATLLAVDAWFDVMTSSGAAFTTALVMAGAAELPLAAVCATLAVRDLTGGRHPTARPERPHT